MGEQGGDGWGEKGREKELWRGQAGGEPCSGVGMVPPCVGCSDPSPRSKHPPSAIPPHLLIYLKCLASTREEH